MKLSFSDYQRRGLIPLAGLALAAYCFFVMLPLAHRAESLEEPLLKARQKLYASLDQTNTTAIDFLLITNQAADRQRPIFAEQFCFLAKSVAEAQKDASKWMHYHGRDARDVLVRIVPPGVAKGDDMHDDWIPR